MQFIDEAKIYVRSGDGGAGCVSFRREAHTPKGGPDGGNGGRGGSVILEVVPNLNTLIDFRYQQHFRAKKGDHGKGKNRDGAYAEDIIIPIPVGTQVFLEDADTIIFDAMNVGQRLVVAKGGDGGQGNANFKSSTNQAPRKATPGWPGEDMWLWLKLKLLSDVGLLGMPNAGKSTLLKQVTRATPKIADYPFTTLKPQLGVVYVDEKEFVMADIPGLIEGAHLGQGLGDRFLKHIERCNILVHLVDGTDPDFCERYQKIRNELSLYSETLSQKPEIVVLNKCDALLEEQIEEAMIALRQVSGTEVFAMSGVTGYGVKDVMRKAASYIAAPSEEEEEEDFNITAASSM